MNGDTLAVMQAISDSRNELTKAIGEVHAEFANFKGSTEARVSELEDKQNSNEKRQWIHSLAVSAAALVHHDLGQWFHWKF